MGIMTIYNITIYFYTVLKNINAYAFEQSIFKQTAKLEVMTQIDLVYMSLTHPYNFYAT